MWLNRFGFCDFNIFCPFQAEIKNFGQLTSIDHF